MPLDITFTLSDRDLERFKSIVNNSKPASNDQQSKADIEQAAHKIVELAMNADLPDFIANRLLQLKVLLQMLQDEEWGLAESERSRIIAALSYFADPADLIPDHIPGIGFLDDAMFVEIVIRELQEEIGAYNEFCEFRIEEESRRQDASEDFSNDRETWLSGKRAELQNRLREFRAGQGDEEFTFHFL